MTGNDAPRREYERRLAERHVQLRRQEAAYRRVAGARLGVAVLLAAVAWMVFWPGWLTPWWLLAPPAAFLWLMAAHSRIDRRRLQITRAIAFYERGLARIDDRWTGSGEDGARFADDDHLYAADLDLFGTGSLFELLSTARTKAGEETLARWLREPADSAEIHLRQDAVRELRTRLDLREDLSTVGPELRSTIHLDKLDRWAGGTPAFDRSWIGHVATGVSVLVILALVYAVVASGHWLYYGMLLAQLAFFLAFRKRAEAVLSAAELPAKELALVSELVGRLESEEFSSPKLRDLRAVFGRDSTTVSHEIRHLARIVDRHLSLKSANGPVTILILLLTGLVVPFTLILLLTLRAAVAIEAWRRLHGPEVRRWILAIGEFEALTALSGYAWEHPADPFPELVDDGPVLEGEGLAHPLLHASECVPNSITLNRARQLIVVSGSNMSGKSTLLRTIGVNTVLALAGAPVRARSLRLSPLAVGATLRIQDSLQAGKSRFYAEITRIRDIMALASGNLPVLFLLDEVLHGTNSHDRAIGAEGIVRGLIDRGAIGVATTHDLALARVADALGERAANVHFEDRMEDGRMAFDYKMKAGVIEKSNALELMRSVGLDV